ncbi:PIG-L deacetylase family protein [Tunicatimonas pelagia]|uniref:PIG-L deacetylase family protein n=1 Tax=Tunicatimonas pelagia TaxID=931531 RepID=UPI0026668F69|nr:PIG-L family deacetylase [Tunicatimonas pelagia]WKN40630.1 PIG-L family deacetylase [Tunicatimonas pelagia]
MNILFIGAHPDDCEVYGGGTAALFAQMGHQVKFISTTNGNAGHHQLMGNDLVDRRSAETVVAAQTLGVAYEVLNNDDGQLAPSVANRNEIIRKIREWQADVVVTHRPNDYHTDHRYTSVMVQDAAYLVMVPNVVMEVPPLRSNPTFFYFADHFQKPYPFSPDVAVDIGKTYEAKIQSLHAHTSQFYEWLPWIDGKSDEVPETKDDRLDWLKQQWPNSPDEKMVASLEKWYGKEKAAQIKHAEAFELCEYGHQPDESEIRQLFPMIK